METFIDICTEEEYFSTIQMVCPYLLRYLTVAMLLNKTYQRYGQFDLYRLVDSINRNVRMQPRSSSSTTTPSSSSYGCSSSASTSTPQVGNSLSFAGRSRATPSWSSWLPRS